MIVRSMLVAATIHGRGMSNSGAIAGEQAWCAARSPVYLARDERSDAGIRVPGDVRFSKMR